MHRVAIWGTGHVGRLAITCVLDAPDLELSAVIVHDPAKDGVDAGELCGRPPTGIVATTAGAEALRECDVLCYTATGDLRPAEAARDMASALERGIDVVSTSIVSLVHPASAADQQLVGQLEKACAAGGASCFTSGIDPGVGNDLFPLTLLGTCSRVDSVRVMEILDYATYDVAATLFDVMGFGGSLEATPLLLLPGVLSGAWGCAVQLMAEGLGVELSEIRERSETIAHDRDLTVAGRVVPAGSQAGMRFEVQGIVGGEPRIIVEHVTRLAADVAPEWPTIGTGGGGYRVEIQGNPNVTMELQVVGTDGDHNTGGLVMGVMRLLHAIPAVREDRPGLLTPFDLPLITGTGAMPANRPSGI
jgi:hypothetical protein